MGAYPFDLPSMREGIDIQDAMVFSKPYRGLDWRSIPFETLQVEIPLEHQEDSGHIYNQAGVDALDAVRAVIASCGAPIAFRKLYSILNAMEMHVEESPYSMEALQHLGKALEATARLYQVDQQQHAQLARAFATFLRTVEKQEARGMWRQRGRGLYEQ